MFTTSRDVLNLVLSICITAFTFFLCWSLYYFIASVRNIHRLIKRIEDGVTKAEEIIALVKDKLKNSSVYLMILGELAKKAIEFIQTKRQEKKEKKEAGKRK
jgi:hypothetical protein